MHSWYLQITHDNFRSKSDQSFTFRAVVLYWSAIYREYLVTAYLIQRLKHGFLDDKKSLITYINMHKPGQHWFRIWLVYCWCQTISDPMLAYFHLDLLGINLSITWFKIKEISFTTMNMKILSVKLRNAYRGLRWIDHVIWNNKRGSCIHNRTESDCE